MILDFLDRLFGQWRPDEPLPSHYSSDSLQLLPLAQSLCPAFSASQGHGRSERLMSLYEQLSELYPNPSNQTSSISIAKRVLSPFLRSFNIQDAWFNDEIINRFMNAIEKESGGTIVALDPLLTAVPNFFERLKEPEQFKALKKSIEKASLLFWPIINRRQHHWSLLIIDRKNLSMYSLDGFNDSTAIESFASTVAQNMGTLCPGSVMSHLKPEQLIIPNQVNTYDCGPAICYWAKMLAKHYHIHQSIPSLPYPRSDQLSQPYTAIREEVAEVLIASSPIKYSSPAMRFA